MRLFFLVVWYTPLLTIRSRIPICHLVILFCHCTYFHSITIYFVESFFFWPRAYFCPLKNKLIHLVVMCQLWVYTLPHDFFASRHVRTELSLQRAADYLRQWDGIHQRRLKLMAMSCSTREISRALAYFICAQIRR